MGYLQAAAASLVAVTHGLLWGWRREPPGYDPELGLVGYELVLVVVALLLAVGGRISVGRSSRLQNRLLALQPLEGLEGLAVVLRDVIGDPSLRLPPPGSPGMPVRYGDRTLAVVSAREGTLADLAVADAVVRAVRLVAVWDERRTGLERSRASLLAARERLARAVVEERAAMGAELGDRVLAKVHQLLVNLEYTGLGDSDSVARAALEEARAQLRTVMGEQTRAKAVRLVVEHVDSHHSEWAAITGPPRGRGPAIGRSRYGRSWASERGPRASGEVAYVHGRPGYGRSRPVPGSSCRRTRPTARRTRSPP